MSGFFEKILEERGSLDLGKKPEVIPKNEENLRVVLDKLSDCLREPKNQETLDRIIGQGSAVELDADIKIAKGLLEAEKLMDIVHSNAKEMLINIETAFINFLKKGKDEETIREEYDKMKKIIDLTTECEEFRLKEFGDKSAYLTAEENMAEGVNRRLRIDEYLEKCEEKRKRQTNQYN